VCRVAAGALDVGRAHASRGDRIAALANFTQAVLATAHGRLAAAGVWALNEKRLVERAELDAAQGLLDGMDVQQVGRSMSELHDLPAWR
jgi:hypothetical protein